MTPVIPPPPSLPPRSIPSFISSNQLEDKRKRGSKEATLAEIGAFFANRVRSNFHVVLSLTHMGNKFRQRCRTVPAILNNCTIDWYNEWDLTALTQVSRCCCCCCCCLDQTLANGSGAAPLFYDSGEPLRLRVSENLFKKKILPRWCSKRKKSNPNFGESKRLYLFVNIHTGTDLIFRNIVHHSLSR